ncbi:MAG TPA: YbaK/EbsC family protein [Vicinamibacterales bacterium]|nr:YbaK/EbsC family protein [Vicinamibacterales bacterium]
MAVAASVQEFLRRSNVAYTVFQHMPAYTAQEEAAVTHVPGRDWAKTVVCFADGEPIQAVVPADREVDLTLLTGLAGAGDVRLAEEPELDWLYPDCERGAMPPFGPLYRQRVFVDEALTLEDEIVFNAGTHIDAVCMRYDDFAAVVRPAVGHFAEPVLV